MKTTINSEKKYIVLTPDEGKWLTNGNTYSLSVYLPFTADEKVWKEITNEEKEELEEIQKNEQDSNT